MIFYEIEDKYPTQRALQDHAAALGLTYKQMQRWFVQKRRKDKRENKIIVPFHSTLSKVASRKTSSSSKYKQASMVKKKIVNRKKNLNQFQEDFFTLDYILRKVFRKDGPPLGVEFDALPSGAFSSHCKGIRQILAIVFVFFIVISFMY